MATAAMVFTAVFGVAVQNGVVMVSYINQLRQQGTSMADAVRIGAEHRLRPVLMTARECTIRSVNWPEPER